MFTFYLSDELYYIIGGAIGGLVLLIIIVATLYVCCRCCRKEHKKTPANIEPKIPEAERPTTERQRNEANVEEEVYYSETSVYSEIPYILNDLAVRDNTINETVHEEPHYMPLQRNNPSEPVYSEAMKDANNMPVHQIEAVYSEVLTDGNNMPVHYTGEECYIEMI